MTWEQIKEKLEGAGCRDVEMIEHPADAEWAAETTVAASMGAARHVVAWLTDAIGDAGIDHQLNRLIERLQKQKERAA
jgi:hypothetical protein